MVVKTRKKNILDTKIESVRLQRHLDLTHKTMEIDQPQTEHYIPACIQLKASVFCSWLKKLWLLKMQQLRLENGNTIMWVTEPD